MSLTVAEELALLAFDAEHGTTYDRAQGALSHAVAGALVAELLDSGGAEIDEQQRITATGTEPTEPLLAEAFRSIAASAKPRRLQEWMRVPSRLVDGGLDGVYRRLVERGVLADEGRTRVMRRRHYEELTGRDHAALVAHLGAVLDDPASGSTDDLLLLAMLPVCRIVDAVFPDRDTHETRERIKELVAGQSPVADSTARLLAWDSIGAIAGAAAFSASS